MGKKKKKSRKGTKKEDFWDFFEHRKTGKEKAKKKIVHKKEAHKKKEKAHKGVIKSFLQSKKNQRKDVERKKIPKQSTPKKKEEKQGEGFLTKLFKKKEEGGKRKIHPKILPKEKGPIKEEKKEKLGETKTKLGPSGSLTSRFLKKRLEEKQKDVERKFAEKLQKDEISKDEKKGPLVKTVFSEIELRNQKEKARKEKFSLKSLFKKKQEVKAKKIEPPIKKKVLDEEPKKGSKGPKIKTVLSEVELKQRQKKKAFGKGSPEQRKKSKEEKAERKKAHIQKRKQSFRLYLYKAGIDTDPSLIRRRLFNISIFIILLASLGVVYYHAAVIEGIDWAAIALTMVGLWSVGFLSSLFVLWIFLYVWVDLRIFKRRLELEEVLPNFLQLTAANIKAGMTIDRALWFAVRPNFGILAHEIEAVAKEVMGGEDLKDALIKFSQRYDSVVLSRSISLIIEGMESGGEIGDLLNKIAMNIEDQRILIKEIAANVNTYAIFITFSSIVAAPFLFALAGVLIQVFSKISSSLDLTGASSGPIPINFAGGGIEFADFRIFALISLMVTATFSAMIISMIRSGSVKKGARNIPIFIIIALSLYGFASLVAGQIVNIFV